MQLCVCGLHVGLTRGSESAGPADLETGSSSDEIEEHRGKTEAGVSSDPAGSGVWHESQQPRCLLLPLLWHTVPHGSSQAALNGSAWA